MAIVLSLLMVSGIFSGIALLVVPELIDAIPLVINNILQIPDNINLKKEAGNLSFLPFADELAKINIDFSELKTAAVQWFGDSRSIFMNYIMDTAARIGNGLVSFIIGLVFSVYILYNKEELKKQVSRLINVWLPEYIGGKLIHITSVCSFAFKNFIAGQTVEAIILGTLCSVGMYILRLPYTPMIGALVGVTALIPVAGAFIGTFAGGFIILTANPFKAFVFVIFLLILQQIEGNIIYPRVVGSSVGLPSIWVLAAITVGGRLAGPVGMFLGVPVVSAAYSLLKENTLLREEITEKNTEEHLKEEQLSTVNEQK